MLNTVLIPHVPLTREHQPHVYTAMERSQEKRRLEMKTKQNISVSSIHTLVFGLDTMEKSQKEGLTEMLKKSEIILHQSNQLEARLSSLRQVANELEQHAPSVNSI